MPSSNVKAFRSRDDEYQFQTFDLQIIFIFFVIFKNYDNIFHYYFRLYIQYFDFHICDEWNFACSDIKCAENRRNVCAERPSAPRLLAGSSLQQSHDIELFIVGRIVSHVHMFHTSDMENAFNCDRYSELWFGRPCPLERRSSMPIQTEEFGGEKINSKFPDTITDSEIWRDSILCCWSVDIIGERRKCINVNV